MLGLLILASPFVLILYNIIGFKKTSHIFYNITRIFSLIYGGVLYAVFAFVMSMFDFHGTHSYFAEIAFAIDVVFLIVVLLIANSRVWSEDETRGFILAIIALNISPILFLLAMRTDRFYGGISLFPLLYHINLWLVSASYIYGLIKSQRKSSF